MLFNKPPYEYNPNMSRKNAFTYFCSENLFFRIKIYYLRKVPTYNVLKRYLLIHLGYICLLSLTFKV